MTGPDDRASRQAVWSFDAFYRAHYAPMVRLAYALTGRLDLAEELAQDAFVACHRRWSQVSHYDNPVAWLRRILTNHCVSSGRRHLTELRLLTRLRNERPTDPGLADHTELLWSAIRGLPRRQAQSLALAFVDDLSVSGIAEVLGIGEESVRTHLRRGRAALAAKLQEERDVD